jgi:hypothetical protein
MAWSLVDVWVLTILGFVLLDFLLQQFSLESNVGFFLLLILIVLTIFFVVCGGILLKIWDGPFETSERLVVDTFVGMSI